MDKKIDKNLKIVLKYFITFIILMILYFALMTLTSLIPSSWMEDNVRKSSEIMLNDGERKVYNLGYKKEYIFTFTDALMINTAYSIDSKDPINSFLLDRKNYIPGQTKVVYPDGQYNLGANEKYVNKANGDLYQTKELYGLMHGDNIEDSYEYVRYWHGYLVLLRPLLTIFDYSGIRMVLTVFMSISIGVLLALLYKKTDIISTIAFVVGLMSVCIWILPKSINEGLIFLTAIICCNILLIKYKKIKNIGIFFFVVGSISSFIDLLTAPIVTLGLCMIVYFLLLQKDNKTSLKQTILKILEVGMSWAIGYALTWASKWIIIQLFFENRPIITEVITQMMFRSKLPSQQGVAIISRFDVISRNLKFLSQFVIIGIIAFVFVNAPTIKIKNRKEKIDYIQNLKECLPFIVTLFLPIAWMMCITQHSYTHAFFVYRILIVSIISLIIIVNKLFQTKKVEEK